MNISEKQTDRQTDNMINNKASLLSMMMASVCDSSVEIPVEPNPRGGVILALQV